MASAGLAGAASGVADREAAKRSDLSIKSSSTSLVSDSSCSTSAVPFVVCGVISLESRFEGA